MFISNNNQKQRETPLNDRGYGRKVTKRVIESVKRNRVRIQFTFKRFVLLYNALTSSQNTNSTSPQNIKYGNSH